MRKRGRPPGGGLNINGRRFGHLLAIRYSHTEKTNTYWVFKCDCGNEKVMQKWNVIGPRGAIACGCRRSSHGMSNGSAKVGSKVVGAKEYRTWRAILSRCKSKAPTAKPYYLDKGIKMCEAWAKDFNLFLKDVGFSPSEKHSLDRIDNAKGYEPGNVRWATASEQVRNRGIGKSNNTGIHGVWYYNRHKKYLVSFKSKTIAGFSSLQNAAATRMFLELQHYGNYNYEGWPE